MKLLYLVLLAFLPSFINAETRMIYKYVDGGRLRLKCLSNDDDTHVFMFWHLPETRVVIGPRNDFNKFKYDYDAVTGTLEIRDLSRKDAGLYSCVSEGVNKQDIKIELIRLEFEPLHNINFEIWWLIPLIVVKISIIIIAISVWYCRTKYNANVCKKIQFDVESGSPDNKVYNATTTTKKEEKNLLEITDIFLQPLKEYKISTGEEYIKVSVEET